jgi:uncharacterized protein
MKIRLDDIPETGLEVTFSGDRDILSQALEHISSPVGVVVDPFIKGRLNLRETTDGIALTGKIRASLNLLCSRCVAEFNLDRNIDLNFVVRCLSQEKHVDQETCSGEADEIIIEGFEIDVGEIIVQELLLELPMNPLCSEDCPGLCPNCGAMRGSGDCKCPAEEVFDPRWEKLAKLSKK